MAQWQDVDTALEPGEHRVIELTHYSVLLVNLAGRFYAVENRCSHDDGELDGGVIDAETVTCPRHGACFCLKTGRVLKPPAFDDIACFAVRIQDGRVQVYDEPNE